MTLNIKFCRINVVNEEQSRLKKGEKHMAKMKNFIARVIIIMLFCIGAYMIFMPKTYASVVLPTSEQKIQFRAVELKENNGNKQLIVEMWIQKLDFKGIDIRLQYDSSLLSISDLTTNNKINISNQLTTPANFEFCNGFEKFMEIMEIENSNGELRTVYSLLTEDEVTQKSDYYVVDENIKEYIHITDYVLIGRFSFQVGEGEITDQSIALKAGGTSPVTGIKINIDGKGSYYEEPTIFEFVLDLESDNAYLSDLVLSTGEKNETENSTYKEYDLTPTFDKETFIYNLEILEYIDKMDLKISKDDEKSTIIMKVPKKDEAGNLVYESDGITIKCEEKEITDDTNLTKEVLTSIELNKLGEPDTIIELVVTAEDGKTTNTYKIVIKRPYGTIKGKIQLGDGLRESMNLSYGVITKYIADVMIYEANQFNWEGIVTGETTLEGVSALDMITSIKSDNEGNYELFIIPGTYDCLMEKKGFLAEIVKNITVSQGDIIDLGTRILIEGDTNRSGLIDLDDMIDIVNLSGSTQGDGIYKEQYDFGQKGFIGLDDLISVTTNMYNTIKIQDYSN